MINVASNLKRVILDLNEGRKRIEKGWTRRAYARDAKSRRVFPEAPSATKWCAVGSCYANPGSITYLRRALYNKFSEDSITDWNDQKGRTQDQVLKLYDSAIELAEKNLAQCT